MSFIINLKRSLFRLKSTYIVLLLQMHIRPRNVDSSPANSRSQQMHSFLFDKNYCDQLFLEITEAFF